ncbi:hypothetical protein B5S31_g3368 [[Candida] boidinii]|nr:hypothetical protein B5S31_g3368 [[Candida] boidinii]OWB79539.1 hypothetical protein B5S32_g3762 [[Candida] boidinii]
MAIEGSHDQEQQKQLHEQKRQQQQQQQQQQQHQQQQQQQHREDGNDTLQTYPVDQRKQGNNQNNYTPSDGGDSFFDLLNVNNSRPGNILNTPGNNFAGLLSFNNNNNGPQGILNSSLQNYTNNTTNGNVNSNGRIIVSNGNVLSPMANNINGTSIPNNISISNNNNNANNNNNTNINGNAMTSFAVTGSAYSEPPKNINNNNNNNKANNNNNNNAQNDNIILDSFLKSFQNGDLFNLFNNLQNNNTSNKNPLYPLPLSLDKNFSNEEQEVIIYKSSEVSTKPTSSDDIGVLLNAEIDLSFAASSALTWMNSFVCFMNL